MTSRTIVDSVERAAGPPANVSELSVALAALRARFPHAFIERYLDRVPSISESVYVGPGAVLTGAVEIHEEASIWPGCVLRGDINRIVVGTRSNVQDGSVIHVGDRDPAIVGAEVVIGHRAVVHGCTLEDAVLVGIQATILDGAVVGQGSVIGAGAVVTAGTRIPPRSLVLGIPGRVVKALPASDEELHRRLAHKYTRLAHNYRHG